MKSNVVNFVMCFLIAMMLGLAGCGGSSDGSDVIIRNIDLPVMPTGKFTTNELTAHTIYASDIPNFSPANTTFGSITAYTFNSNGTVTEAINMTTTSTSSASKILSGTYTIDSSGVVIVSIEIPLKKTEKLIKIAPIADAYNSFMVESNYDTGTGTGTVISRWFFDVTQGANQALAFAQNKSIPDLLTPTVSSFTPASGPTGSSFTISGTNFSTIAAQNTVKLNGINAIVTNATSSQLVVTVPSGATTGPVSVTVGSATVTSSSNFTVTP
jgi:hypothetical protein